MPPLCQHSGTIASAISTSPAARSSRTTASHASRVSFEAREQSLFFEISMSSAALVKIWCVTFAPCGYESRSWFPAPVRSGLWELTKCSANLECRTRCTDTHDLRSVNTMSYMTVRMGLWRHSSILRFHSLDGSLWIAGLPAVILARSRASDHSVTLLTVTFISTTSPSPFRSGASCTIRRS